MVARSTLAPYDCVHLPACLQRGVSESFDSDVLHKPAALCHSSCCRRYRTFPCPSRLSPWQLRHPTKHHRRSDRSRCPLHGQEIQQHVASTATTFLSHGPKSTGALSQHGLCPRRPKKQSMKLHWNLHLEPCRCAFSHRPVFVFN